MAAPPGWSGRMWARTGCEFDAEGAGTCQTGDCGSRMECGGAGALPPATLFEITLGKGKDPDYYDVSLVDGYNLPVAAAPRVPRGRMKRSGGFSTGQAINGHGDESDPLAMASSATVVSFHPSFLLMSLLFFQAALNELITSAFMNKVGVQ
ncbi:hypothetical protein COCNU_11G013370 [Cocos nucifera]|uniref:Thaumatin-like protein 1 n=1 Tax=Cocos nucifera TaxID=13894 RepID=A0A8K0IQN2_COCNU|nr:hypothetical protein COCNU_11G013370 [Cocos nucifera]